LVEGCLGINAGLLLTGKNSIFVCGKRSFLIDWSIRDE
jgi:hypothetical protein